MENVTELDRIKSALESGSSLRLVEACLTEIEAVATEFQYLALLMYIVEWRVRTSMHKTLFLDTLSFVAHHLHWHASVVPSSGSPAANLRAAVERRIREAADLITAGDDRERLLDVLRSSQERARIEAERRQQAETRRVRREELFRTLLMHFETRFLSAEPFYRAECTGHISEEEYQEARVSFVKRWLPANVTPSSAASGVAPDDQQAAAIAAVNGNVQVVARAGSGKTLTLVLRALFLIKHCGIDPREMLLLAFNRKAAREMRRRLLGLLHAQADAQVETEIQRRLRDRHPKSRKDRHEIQDAAVGAVATVLGVTLPHVMTFHALAYALVQPSENLLYDDTDEDSTALSSQAQELIDNWIRGPEYEPRIRTLMLAHFRTDWERIEEGRYNRLREEFLRYRRSLPRQSLRGDHVKSWGEKLIADFLFEHDIAYRYEQRVTWSGRNYTPDFTIPAAAGPGVIVEYFGMKGDPDYDEMSEQKREYWARRHGWTLLEFTPADVARSGTSGFYALLKRDLEAQGVRCTRLSEDEIWHQIRQRAVDRFTRAVVAFIQRCRQHALSPENVRDLVVRHQTPVDVEAMFLEIAQDLYDTYLQWLEANQCEDFNGLMQRAAVRVAKGHTLFQRQSERGDPHNVKFVFVDEYQDFSEQFYRLLCAVQHQNPKVDVYCVGDDWQAINGFAGSELRFFTDFTEYFADARQLNLTTNYRSHSAIVKAGNALMTGLGAPARAHQETTGVAILCNVAVFEPTARESEIHAFDTVTPAILRLIASALADDLDVVMIARRNAAPWLIPSDFRPRHRQANLHDYLRFIRSHLPKRWRERVTISTAHKYKGLEKPAVIVVDALARSYPLLHPDWIFGRVFGETLDSIVAEERRLFYVALTRAVSRLFIVTDTTMASPFAAELERLEAIRPIDWADYRPVAMADGRVTVQVGSQSHTGGTPTVRIRGLLKAGGYQWRHQRRTTGWPCWEKTFPATTFHIGILKSEVWAASADGIEVRVLNSAEQPIEIWSVDAGIWTPMVSPAVEEPQQSAWPERSTQAGPSGRTELEELPFLF